MFRVLTFILLFIQKLFIKGLLDKNHCSGTGERFSEHKAWMLKGANVCHDLRIFRESEEKAVCIYVKLWKGIRASGKCYRHPCIPLCEGASAGRLSTEIPLQWPREFECEVLPAGAEGADNP